MSKPERVGTVTLLASICLTFGVPTSEAIVIRHDVEAALYRAEPETFPSVLSFLWRPEAGVPETTSLSGTLLSHHWVLTAAHGAEEFEQTTLRIEVGGIVYDEVPFDAWHPHPCFDSADTPSDVGLVYFAAPPWPRLDAYPSLQRTPDELGKVIVFVGKGAPGDGLTGSQKDEPDGALRNATNTVDHTDPLLVGFTFNRPSEATVTMLEGISGPGDSGGPAFMCEEMTLDAAGRLACLGDLTLLGVSSHQLSYGESVRGGTYGVSGRYARVSSYTHWIEATMATGDAGSCGAQWYVPAHDGAVGGCSAGDEARFPLWLIAVLTLIALFRRPEAIGGGARRPSTCRPSGRSWPARRGPNPSAR